MTKDEWLKDISTEAIETVRDIVNNDKDTLEPLPVYIWLNRLEKLSKSLRSRLLKDANESFKKMMKEQPSLKKWQPLPFATLTATSPKSEYIYPEDILDMEAKVRALKEIAKTENKAKKSTVDPDIDKDQLFKIKLHEV